MPLRRWRALALSLALLTVGLCAPFLFSGKVVMNRSDVFEHVGPFRHAAARELQAGRFPLWNPHLFCGVPFLGASQAALLYPPSQLFYFFPLAQAVNVFTALHIFLNALGMGLLLFRMSRSRPAAWLGALAWGFSRFFLAHVAAGHVIHLSGYAWAAFAALFLTSVERPGCAAGLAAAAALCFLSGHLQVAGQVGVVLAFEAVIAGRGRWKGLFKGCARALLITGGLVAAQALPSAAFLLRSTRAGRLFFPEDARRFAASYSLEPRALATFLFPGHFGHPFDGTFHGGPGSVFFESYGLYIGLIPLALGIFGMGLLVRRKNLRPWAALVFFLMALGDHGPLFPLVWRALAGMRAPARWMAGALWGLVLCGAPALKKFYRRRGVQAALILATVLDLGMRARPFLRSEDPDPYWSASALMRSLPWDAGLPPRLALGAETPLEDKVMFYGLSNVGGYEAQVPSDLASFVARADPAVGMPTTGVDVEDPSRAGFQVLDIDYALLARPVPGWRPRARVGPGTLSENPAPGSVVRLLAGRARLLSLSRPSAERLDTRWNAQTGFTALWAEDFDPGWEAYAGGKRAAVREAFGTLQSVEVEDAGPGTAVRWRYRPLSARTGIPLGALAWALMAAWGVARLKKLI